MDVTSSAEQLKRFVERPGQFVARQLEENESRGEREELFPR